ncbi:MAG: 4-oxalomesaconate tautomerase [Betaproteobacteria bacterium]|nr:MAG: 4-oxalomesaconate tautomerase [Betaproteobacteria bacterium]
MMRSVPCLLMRGGTSRGPFFLSCDLPSDALARDRVLLSIMGSPDARQIDGLGGANPLTSKVGIVSISSAPGIDLDFLFAQVSIDEPRVDTTPNCGNMLAAVVPFALETGLVTARDDLTTLRVRTINTGTVADITVQTPNQRVSYAGDARIDGVPGSGSPVMITFLHTAGSVCGSLLPTGNAIDVFDEIETTCIDNGMPVVAMLAADLGISGYESSAELNESAALRRRIESIRIQAGRAMGLGDVSARVVPKVSLVAAPQKDGTLCSRTFIPHQCHSSIGVLGAVTLATAAAIRGTTVASIVNLANRRHISIEHPSGEFSIELNYGNGNSDVPQSASLLRTARLIMRGEVMVPDTLFSGSK